MRSSLRLGKLLGIPFGINYTWFIIFFIVTLSLRYYFHQNYAHWSVTTYWLAGIGTSLLFFASVVVHELAHSVVSKANGIPVKSITLFIFGGVSQIARESTRPATELVMAAAGPLSSLAVAAFFTLIWFLTSGVSEPLAAMAGYLALINVLLAFFNMIPGFPLDGGRVLRSILWWITGNHGRATWIASLIGRGIAYLFILGGVLIMFLGHWLIGLWWAFMGWFLESAASGSYRQVVLRDTLQGFTAADLMSRDCPLVPHHLTIKELVQGYVLNSGRHCFFIGEEDRLEGIVTLHHVKKVSRARWDTTSVAEAMTPAEELKVAHPEEEAVSVLEKMTEDEVDQIAVVEDGRVLGVIGRDNLLRFMHTRSELGV